MFYVVEGCSLNYVCEFCVATYGQCSCADSKRSSKQVLCNEVLTKNAKNLLEGNRAKNESGLQLFPNSN